MPRMTYVGPHDSVDVAGLTVARGESADLPKDLLDQPDNWQPAKAAPNKKES